jgi:hypothetical protein
VRTQAIKESWNHPKAPESGAKLAKAVEFDIKHCTFYEYKV